MPLALFDVDHTLIRRSTGNAAVQFYRARGRIGWREALDGARWGLLHYLNRIDVEAMMQKLLQPFVGQEVAALEAEMAEMFAEVVRAWLYVEAIERLEAHRAAGDRVVLLTASSRYAAGPIAQHLGVELVGTAAVVADGRFTDGIVRPIPYGPGKLHWAERVAADSGESLTEATFYSDSFSDLPLLDAVGRPVAVNPDPKLRRIARQRGWETLRFSHTVG